MLVFAREPHVYALTVGFIIAAAGEVLRLWATGHLTKNVELTTSGPYAHIRHPMYVGTFLIMAGFLIAATIPSDWSVSFLRPNLYILLVSFLVFVFYYFPYKDAREADRLIRRFGEPAKHWIENVPRFLPRFKPFVRLPNSSTLDSPLKADRKWSIKQLVENSEEGVPLVILIGFALIARSWWIGGIIGENAPAWILGK